MELTFDVIIAVVFVVDGVCFFALVIGDGKDERYARVDTKHFVFRLALNILWRAGHLRVKLIIICYLRNVSFHVTLIWHSSLDDERQKSGCDELC